MSKIEIYTDGSSVIDKKFYESSSAVHIYVDDELAYRGGCYHKNGTNSLGEVYAVYIALNKMKEIIDLYEDLDESEISVYCDSDYVVKSLTSYIKSWVKGGWISYKSGKPVMYQNYFKEIYNKFLMRGKPYNIRFHHINSHLEGRTIQSGRYAFMKRNECDITFEEFIKHVARNCKVDELATSIRKTKTYWEEESTWIDAHNTFTVDGAFVIRGNEKERK